MRYWSRGRRLVLAALVAVLGGAGFLVYTLFFWYEPVAVVASGGVAALEAVRPQQVETRWLPRAAVHPQAVRRAEDAVGKFARRPLAGAQAFLSSDLVQELPRDTLVVGGLQVPPGHVLAGVKLDVESALGGLLRAGSLVDLIAVPKDGGPAQMFGQKVLVVAVSGDQGQPLEAGKGLVLSPSLAPGPARPGAAVLAVIPEQALELASRAASGRVVLVLTSQGAPDLTLPLMQKEDMPGVQRVGSSAGEGRQP